VEAPLVARPVACNPETNTSAWEPSEAKLSKRSYCRAMLVCEHIIPRAPVHVPLSKSHQPSDPYQNLETLLPMQRAIKCISAMGAAGLCRDSGQRNKNNSRVSYEPGSVVVNRIIAPSGGPGIHFKRYPASDEM
jgi:hypothetical protein